MINQIKGRCFIFNIVFNYISKTPVHL